MDVVIIPHSLFVQSSEAGSLELIFAYTFANNLKTYKNRARVPDGEFEADQELPRDLITITKK